MDELDITSTILPLLTQRLMIAESYRTPRLLQQENHQHTPERQWHPQTIQVTTFFLFYFLQLTATVSLLRLLCRH
jgi:hypothetical protein